MKNFTGKKVLVMGLGLHGGGAGAAEFFARKGARVTVTDLRSARELKESLAKLKKFKDIRYVLGKHEIRDFTQTDLVVKNPGVKPDSPYLKAALRRKIPVTTEIGLFLASTPAIVIGVTGSRGKSTTATLIYEFLKAGGKRVYLGGNIRKSVLAFAEPLKKNDIVVLELSSFQLADIEKEKISPPVAVLTNVLRDHINWHGSAARYRAAKAVIFKFQKKSGLLITNPLDSGACVLAKKAPGRVLMPKLAASLRKIVDKNLGEHYRPAAALALAAGKYFGVPRAKMEKVLKKFRGLGGRQEVIAVKLGIKFINDTTATSPDATRAALRRFAARGRKNIILIAGGTDKKLDFRKMAREIAERVKSLVLLPGTGTDKLKKLLPRGAIIELQAAEARSMEQAVREAWRRAGRGDIILLSPGAASFGLFRHEFERGDKFAEAVRKL